jgi:hypothetical protein
LWLGAIALAAAAALTLGVVDTTAAGDKGLEQESVTLPPELAWVPPDAGLFVTVRPAAVWNSPEGRILRDQFPDIARDIERICDEEFAAKPGELETVTVVICNWSFLRGDRDRFRGPRGGPGPKDFDKSAPIPPPIEKEPAKDPAKDPVKDGESVAAANEEAQPPEREGEPSLLWIATTTEAATLERIHKDAKANFDAKKHNDKTYYDGTDKRRGEHAAYHFVNDRTFVRGTTKHVLKGMERTDNVTKGSLAPALRMAKEKHQLAVGMQLDDKSARNLLEEFLPGHRGMGGVRRALAPLFRARAAAGFADIGRETRAEVQLFFRDGTQAKVGLGAAEDGLTLLRVHVLNEIITQLDFDIDDGANPKRDEESMFGIQIMEQLEAGLRGMRTDLKGGLLRVNAHAATDLTAMLAKNKELLKTRAGDEAMMALRQMRKIQNNLRQIGFALQAFHDSYKSFPPVAICDKNGKPLLSWRVAILPYIEQAPLFQQFKLDEPWDSEHNLKLLAQMPPIYAPVGVTTREKHVTFYQGFIADPKAGGEHQTAWEMTPAPNNAFGATGTRIASITDGMSNTLMVVEAGEAVPWTKPGDLPYDPKRRLPKLGGMSKDGFHVLMADGSTLFLPRDFDEKTLRLLITRADGQVLPPAFEQMRN